MWVMEFQVWWSLISYITSMVIYIFFGFINWHFKGPKYVLLNLKNFVQKWSCSSCNVSNIFPIFYHAFLPTISLIFVLYWSDCEKKKKLVIEKKLLRQFLRLDTWIKTIKMPIETNNWDVEIYRNKFEIFVSKNVDDPTWKFAYNYKWTSGRQVLLTRPKRIQRIVWKSSQIWALLFEICFLLYSNRLSTWQQAYNECCVSFSWP